MQFKVFGNSIITETLCVYFDNFSNTYILNIRWLPCMLAHFILFDDIIFFLFHFGVLIAAQFVGKMTRRIKHVYFAATLIREHVLNAHIKY